jgi:hypothetical protein
LRVASRRAASQPSTGLPTCGTTMRDQLRHLPSQHL